MNEYELSLQRVNTEAYILSDPTDVVFIPRARTSDGQGGFVWSTPDPLSVQTVRVAINSSSTGSRTVEGETAIPDFILICLWDADVKFGYRLMIEEDLYEVIFVASDLQYEKIAEVIRR